MIFTGQELDAHRRAQAAFAAVLADVKEDELDDSTPCTEWTVRELISHVVAGNQRVGGGVADVPSDAGTLVAAHAASGTGAQTTFAAPDGLTRTFDVPFGTVPGAVFVGLRTTDVLVHAWDLARATGQETDLDPELADAMLEWSRRMIRPDLRGPGRPFADEQPSSPTAPLADQLAAFLGRR